MDSNLPRSGLWRRRDVIRAGLAATAYLSTNQHAAAADQPDNVRVLPNGGSNPFPIPWLDKNGSHNQPAGPDAEPSHIYHFKGRVGRCAGFTGWGTDNKQNRLAFGTRTTDYGYMDGEYFAGRVPHRGSFTHI